jgi:hypothetical protein
MSLRLILRAHGVKFQGISTPDGIVRLLHGPFAGSYHDSKLWKRSDVNEVLRTMPLLPSGRPPILYGDSAYALSSVLAKPFPSSTSPSHRACNLKMAKLRINVEMCFGNIKQFFSFIDFRKNLKNSLQPVGQIYRVGVLLSNARSCCYGNSSSACSDMRPPTLNDYFSAL